MASMKAMLELKPRARPALSEATASLQLSHVHPTREKRVQASTTAAGRARLCTRARGSMEFMGRFMGLRAQPAAGAAGFQ